MSISYRAQTASEQQRQVAPNPPASDGTTLVKDINPSGDSFVYDLTVLGGTLFFFAYDGFHGGLWKSDGTTAGTTLVKDINSAIEIGSNLADMTAVGNTLFFVADDGVHGRELWTSDGTEADTTMVQDLSPGEASSDPSQFTRIGTTVFFNAATRETGAELWATLAPPFLVYLPQTHR
jgi:ELWxxDGT repeat protein